MRDYREVALWKDIAPDQWNDWRWQVANRIKNVDSLRQVIDITEDEAIGI